MNALYFFASIVLAIALGLAIADRNAKRRALKRVRKILADVRAERNAAIEELQFGPDEQRPVWTTGAPVETGDDAFDAIINHSAQPGR